MRAALLTAFLVLATPALAQDADVFDLGAAPDTAARLPTAAERATAVAGLARRPDVTVESALAAIRALAPASAAAPGTRRERASIEIEGRATDVLIHVHVPESYDPDVPAPLMLAFHGTGGTGASDIAMWEQTSEALGMIVVAPDDHGENVGYRFSQDERDAALGALRWAQLTFRIDADRVHASGVSRGGHLTWDLALRHPDVFASIAPMVGGPRLTFSGGQNNTRYVANVARLPIRDLQGLGDDPLLIANLRYLFERLDALGASDAQFVEFPELGHSFDFGAVDWVAFLGAARRPAQPVSVTLAASRLADAQAFWLGIRKLDKGVKHVFQPRVDPRKWAALTADQQRREVLAQVEAATAVLHGVRSGPGRFEVSGKGAKNVRLLLTEDDVDSERAVEVRWRGKTVKRRATPDVSVLLADWVERLDPGFLPIAELRL